jgi:hypothetical protein
VDTWFVVCGPGSDTREKSAHDRCPVSSKFVDSWAWTCADVQQLETLLSRHLGNQAWHESGLGSPACTEELQQTITKLEQRTADLTTALEGREAELKAAREANRQLTRALNQRE